MLLSHGDRGCGRRGKDVADADRKETRRPEDDRNRAGVLFFCRSHKSSSCRSQSLFNCVAVGCFFLQHAAVPFTADSGSVLHFITLQENKREFPSEPVCDLPLETALIY